MGSGAIIRRRRRWFASAADEPRARRATDVLRLLGAVIGLVFSCVLAEPPTGFERALRSLVAAVPRGLDGLWELALDGLALLALAVIASALISRRLAVLRDVVLAALVAGGISVLIGRLVNGSWPMVWEPLRTATRSLEFPSIRLATTSALIMAASPHLTRPARRLGRWVVLTGASAAMLLGVGTPIASVAALLVAVIGAAAVHLVFGSCRGRPSLDDVTNALSELGVSARSLQVDARQSTGVFLADATDRDGHSLFVKFYGRDAYDTQLVTTAWRALWYRHADAPVARRRLQQVEHEAFLTLLADQSGVLTDQVITAAATVEDDALLALRRSGTRLDEMPDGWQPAVPGRVWEMLEQLHGLGIAHGQVDAHHLVMDGDRVGLVNFGGGSASASTRQLQVDRVQALTAIALAIGPGPALTLAVERLGAEGLADLLPLLQPSVVTPRQREALRAQKLELDSMRDDAAQLAGVDTPDLQRLRRITPGSALQVVLLVVVFSVVATGIGGLDLDNLWQQIADARWWLVAVGLVIAQAPRPAQAVASMGAAPIPLPLAPLYALQLALSYIGLAIPGSAARFAVNVRFFQRKGMPAGTALAASALDSTFWFAVLGGLLVSIIAFTPASLDLDLGSGTSSGLLRLVVMVALLALAALIVVFLVPSWRRAVSTRLRQAMGDAREAARGLWAPGRLAMLIGGNLAIALLFATALGAFTAALGYPIGFINLLFIHVSVSLLAGIVPVPGGIGVVEAGLTYGLTRAGMPEDAAFAAALLFRLATFYLPPAWGVFALRWLERTGHL